MRFAYEVGHTCAALSVKLSPNKLQLRGATRVSSMKMRVAHYGIVDALLPNYQFLWREEVIDHQLLIPGHPSCW